MDKIAAARTVGEALSAARLCYGTRVSYITTQALLSHATGYQKAWLAAHHEAPLSIEQAYRFAAAIARAADGEPLAYITGEREFGMLSFHVEPGVLVPRPETESLVDEVVHWVHVHVSGAPRIIDVGTGSGVIAVSLAARLPHAYVVASDITMRALKVTRINAERHRVMQRIGLVQGSLLEPFAGPFDVIAANLPYIDSSELTELDVGVWEPLEALNGGSGGLALVDALLRQSPSRLAVGGLIALEIGYNQGLQAVEMCVKAFPEARVTLHQDLAGLDRIITVNTSIPL